MHALKTMWRILISLPVAVVWVVMAGLLFIGWGLPQVDRFIRGWNASMEDEVDGPIHVGPLPPEPWLDDLTESGYTFRELEAADKERKRGEGIG